MAILTELTQEEAASYSAAAEAEYAVFLSFRGEDTRLSFTDHLYQALLDANIPTFLDEEEVETGEDLKPELAKAIRNSRASIIVLSQNYASSRWCLDELVMILEQRRTSNHIVLPIFYNIDPSHVRKQQGSFGDALVEHKRKLEAEKDPEKKRQGARKLVSWTEGLAEVADLKGMNATGRRETVFIKEIVKEISSKLELHLQSKVPDLIGMDDSISFIDSWLKEGPSETADLLTIGGMAGIGKTTLAKYIYMLHYRDFEGYCFLEDIERSYAEKSSALLDLQKRLLEDILKKKSKVEVRDVNECIGKIQEALLNKCTLVVLDDVGDVEQLNMLIGTKGFHPGSKIIITTKDMSLTKKYCALFCTSFPLKLTMHELSCLSDAESLRLFCRHAFGGHSGPKEGYEEEATNFVKYCGGHLLALKVLGGSLLGKDVAKWRDVFEMLKTKELKAIKSIQNILRVSFDCLSSENCQELFKHIACFLVGEDRKATELILNECGIHVSYGITELIDRCLLTIGDGNKLKMHQLLQEMGRDLVHQESPDEPGKRSRLWNHEESLKLLKDDKGTEKIQGLFLDMKMLERQWVRGSSSATEHKFRDDLVLDKIKLRTDVLKKMDGLNLLQLNHVKLKGSYMNFPKGLRSLCMHGFRLKHIPSELPTENLVALDMSYSDLKQLWKKPKMYYEFGIFSTCFLGKEVPDWFGHRSKGSSISFTISSSPTDRRIQGLNICFVHTFSGSTEVLSFLGTKVSNVTKNRTWIYYGFICVDQEGDEDIVWLSHWMLGNEEFEDGDEVSVTVAEEEDEFMVRECAISPVYDDGVKEEDPLGYYKSWKNVIGGDLSRFQLTSGDYFLIQDRFIYGGGAFQELFEQKTIQSLVGYKGEYPDANPHPPRGPCSE